MQINKIAFGNKNAFFIVIALKDVLKS